MVITPDSQPKLRGRPAKTDGERLAMQRRITQTAQRMFQDEGYATVSMRRLAKEVGCSPMTLYQYFDGKIGILQTLWASVFNDLFGGLRACLDEHADAKRRLLAGCQYYVRYWLLHPEHYRLVFMAEGILQPDVSMFIDNPEITAGFGLLMELVAEAHDSSEDPAETKVILDLLMGTMHGIAHNSITVSGYPWTDADKLIERILKDLI